VNKGRRILIALAVAISAAGLTITLWPRDKEPGYGGKKLSVWLGPTYLGSRAVSDKDKAEAISAIRHIGTNAIPSLVGWVAYETPRRTQNLLRFLDRRPLRILQRPLLESERRRQMRASGALLAFRTLGTDRKTGDTRSEPDPDESCKIRFRDTGQRRTKVDRARRAPLPVGRDNQPADGIAR
jgi:hypothetical protein